MAEKKPRARRVDAEGGGKSFQGTVAASELSAPVGARAGDEQKSFVGVVGRPVDAAEARLATIESKIDRLVARPAAQTEAPAPAPPPAGNEPPQRAPRRKKEQQRRKPARDYGKGVELAKEIVQERPWLSDAEIAKLIVGNQSTLSRSTGPHGYQRVAKEARRRHAGNPARHDEI